MGGVGVHSICIRHKNLVGAGLLAKASAQPTSPQTDPPLSRASSLPQGGVGVHSICIRHKNLWERACSRRRRHSQHHHKLIVRFREQARSHRRNAFTPNQVGYKAASLRLLIWGAPLNHVNPK